MCIKLFIFNGSVNFRIVERCEKNSSIIFIFFWIFYLLDVVTFFLLLIYNLKLISRSPEPTSLMKTLMNIAFTLLIVSVE